MNHWWLGSLGALVTWAACSGAGGMPSPDGAPVERRCRAEGGVSGAPGSIAGVVALANALPRPLSLSCFLESLDRPLHVHTTRSTVSLQPSAGDRSPRIFLFSGSLILSVVPEGKGSPLMEMGQLVDPARSLKAEIRFPLEGPLGPDDPYEHVRDANGTTCRFCHPDEAPAPQVAPAAYVSGAFKPSPGGRVTLDFLAQERARCDGAAEPDRCAILRALFDHGEVRWREFPASVPTAFRQP